MFQKYLTQLRNQKQELNVIGTKCFVASSFEKFKRFTFYIMFAIRPLLPSVTAEMIFACFVWYIFKHCCRSFLNYWCGSTLLLGQTYAWGPETIFCLNRKEESHKEWSEEKSWLIRGTLLCNLRVWHLFIQEVLFCLAITRTGCIVLKDSICTKIRWHWKKYIFNKCRELLRRKSCHQSNISQSHHQMTKRITPSSFHHREKALKFHEEIKIYKCLRRVC